MSTDPFTGPNDRQPGEFARTKMGAPKVSRPDDPTKTVIYSRASGYCVDPNPYNLLKWKERQLVAGLLALYDIDIDPAGDKDALDAIINDAYDASATDLAARRGTHIHAICEQVVNGEPYTDLLDVGELLGIPSSLQESIVKEFVIARQRLGVRVIAAELQIVNDDIKAAGTADLLDLAERDIVTGLGTIHAGQAVIGDIKTGSLYPDAFGRPLWWVKYGPQLVIYRDGVPYDVDTDTRLEWPVTPHPDIALIWHYDLKRALDGEMVEWLAIPVDLNAARDGVTASMEIKEYAKRRDVFAPPIAAQESRREQLMARYALLNDTAKEMFSMLGITKTSTDDEVQAALDSIDPFAQVQPLAERPADPTPATPVHVAPDEGTLELFVDDVKRLYEALPDKTAVNTLVGDAQRAGLSMSVKEQPTERRVALMRGICTLAMTDNLWPDILKALLLGLDITPTVEPFGVQLGRLHAHQAVLFAQRANETALTPSPTGTPAGG